MYTNKHPGLLLNDGSTFHQSGSSTEKNLESFIEDQVEVTTGLI